MHLFELPATRHALAIQRAAFTNARRLLTLVCFLAAGGILRLLGIAVSAWVFGLFAVWIAAAAGVQLLIGRFRTAAQVDVLQAATYALDLSMLTAMYAFVGGGWWLGAAIHGFVITFAFASVPKRLAIPVAAYAGVTFVGLLTVQALGLLRPQPFLGVPSLEGNYRLTAFAAVIGAVTLVLLAVVQHAFVRLMRRSQEHYRVLVETAPELILRLGIDANVRSANRAALAFAGRPFEDLAGRPIGELGLDTVERSLHHYARLAAQGESAQFEAAGLNAAGDRRHFVCSVDPIREDRAITGVLFVAGDTTEQQRALAALRERDEQLRQAQKMEAIGQLTSGIAHDFNNLLSVVLANSQIVSKRLAPDETDLRESLADIARAARDGANMIQKLLGYSRHAALSPVPVDLRNVLRDLTTVLRRLLPDHIEMELAFDDPIPTVRADAGAIQQILFNLATNARDAMPDGGKLRLALSAEETDPAYLRQHPWVVPGAYVCLEVRDTGAGMDATTQARIFEPFFTTKPPERGTGLGMAMIYGLVKQHQGYTHVYSELGRGTTVQVYFPASGEREETARRSRFLTGELTGGGETILVVEDDEPLRRAAVRALEAAGFGVRAAADGIEALQHLERGIGVDLIFCDLMMPRMTGQELYRTLDERGAAVPFLFTTGYTSEQQEAAELGPLVLGVLPKPWNALDVVRAIRAALDDRSPAPDAGEP